MLKGRVCEAFLAGVDASGLSAERVPSFDAINAKLTPATGWEIVAVPGLVPDQVFFEHLANRRFPVTWWMRRPDQLDYLQEPDCFHDLFGHVPLLINPVFADYMHAYGRAALAADDAGALPLLARLYWYTVEFGLIRDAASPNGVQIYGAGIVSSKGETLYSQQSAAPEPARLRPRTRHAHPLPHRHVSENLLRDRRFRAIVRASRKPISARSLAKLADEPRRSRRAPCSSPIASSRAAPQEGWQTDGDV